MGWVSFLEDAIERFEDSFHRLQADMPSNQESVSVEQWRSIASLLSRGEKVLSEAAAHLDLATDPTIDLAHELMCSVEEARELKNKVNEFQKTCLSLMTVLRRQEGELKELREEAKYLRIEKNKLEKKLEAALRENPAAVYEQYMKGSGAKRK
ncbi:MAG: hypothetical protein H5U26_06455 [Immundisolibacter sp.]|uniref:hypothetical protein n=1 Tax=Immundisolibacter sp. TaxID=1934948 RepID=UPI0019931F28|nr:hypothetical protein [Immundisolibacter sp.]MBC7161729.1 hypothetical protein [Immundisolibacter sp.]